MADLPTVFVLLQIASVLFYLAVAVGIAWLVSLLVSWVSTNGGPHA